MIVPDEIWLSPAKLRTELASGESIYGVYWKPPAMKPDHSWALVFLLTELSSAEPTELEIGVWYELDSASWQVTRIGMLV